MNAPHLLFPISIFCKTSFKLFNRILNKATLFGNKPCDITKDVAEDAYSSSESKKKKRIKNEKK